jgi:hypothetical protein
MAPVSTSAIAIFLFFVAFFSSMLMAPVSTSAVALSIECVHYVSAGFP